MYDGTIIEVDGFKFEFKVTPWKAYGDDYAWMKKAPGQTLDKFPDNGNESRTFKRAAAKANLTMEIMNILKGGSFDHYRHVKQQNIERLGNNLLPLPSGLYFAFLRLVFVSFNLLILFPVSA